MIKPRWILTALLALLLGLSAFGQSAPFGDSPKAGADYATYAERLPTVKLTDAEALNLITTIHAVLDAGEIQRADVDAAMVEVFGELRAAEYMRLFDARSARGERWSRRENVAMIAAMYPHIPGETEEKKADWLITRAAPCFSEERWNNEVFPYVLERVQEYKDAGGTLDRWPEVVVPPEPESDIPPGTVWLHADVSAWPVTATLDASIAGGQLLMPYDKAKDWPATSTTAGSGLNANPWVIVEIDGTWYAGTFEWLRLGQNSKPLSTVAGDHVKASPLSGSWRPAPGQRFGVMVSGLSRHTERNVQERSNVSWLTYPGTPSDPEQPAKDPPPATSSSEFSWIPASSHVDVTIPAGIRPWKAAVFSHHARKDLWVSETAANTYRIPIAPDTLRDRSAAAQQAAGKNATGAVNVFINTRDVEIPATGRKYAGWEIPDPRRTYRGESTRVLTPDGPNRPLP